MARSAKNRAMPHKIASAIRREFNLSRAAFARFHFYADFAEAQAMRHIGALQNQIDWLTLFQADLRRLEREFLRRHFHTVRGALSACLSDKNTRSRNCGQKKKKQVKLAHKLSSWLGQYGLMKMLLM